MADSGTSRGLTVLRGIVALLALLTVGVGWAGQRLWTPAIGVIVLVAALLALTGVSEVSRRRMVWLAVAVCLVVLMGYDILFPAVPPGIPPGG